jgi:hypothetical protein
MEEPVPAGYKVLQFIFALGEMGRYALYLAKTRNSTHLTGKSKPKLRLTALFLVVFALKAAVEAISTAETPGLVHKLIQVALLFIACVRLLTFLRLFLSIGFIVSMLLEVVPRLGGFLTILLILNLNFAAAIAVLGQPLSSELASGGKLGVIAEPLAFVVLVFKLSLGDLGEKFSSSDTVSNYLILAIWLLIVLFIYIIMLNFVIAVVGETYQDVKDFYKQCHFQYKAEINEQVWWLPES